MRFLSIFWKFTRPHTIIGSVLSLSTLHLVAYKYNNAFSLGLFFTSIIIGICTNIFIVGINQIADIDIDRINKPNLPIPSGILSLRAAKQIVVFSAIISCVLATFISIFLLLIILLSLFIGWAYSMPPLYLKKHHLTAAFAIAFVRAILLNFGGYMVFSYYLNQVIDVPFDIIILTFFVFLFSIVISWFKDLPDIEGDKEYNIKTLAITYSVNNTFKIGNMVVVIAYLLAIFFECYLANFSELTAKDLILIVGHVFIAILFVINSYSINLNEKKSTVNFYKRFWFFFFAEYLLYFFAFLF